ncbi:MAG TPA: hypothetical protein VFE54_00660 [Mucilaginibacter sp.]|jgi:hypothetical protein|nr:hypothetical protein [Mucilaginibacter sp.]
MAEKIYKLKSVDPADINGVLVKIQRSFNIKLDNEGLKNVDTIGSLCDLIINKINLEHEENCTTQHAFYLLRNSIATSVGKDKCTITPHTRLSNLFPRENRLQMIQEIEHELGFDTNLLQPKQWILVLFSSLFIGSLIGCYFNWELGIAGILASVAGYKLAGKFGKEIHLKTVGDLASKISRESYLKARRNSFTINKNEIEQKVRELFADDLGFQPVMIRRESQF